MDMVATAAAIDDRPSAFRYPRGEGVGRDMPERGRVLEIGKGRVVQEGTKVALLNFGARVRGLVPRKVPARALFSTRVTTVLKPASRIM